MLTRVARLDLFESIIMTLPWHVRVALTVSLLLPVYFIIAALGTKFGVWGWRMGLGKMVIGAGPILIGTVALIAFIAFGITIARPPRKGWKSVLVALAIPLIIFGGLTMVRARSSTLPPIHDVATDTITPPPFSAAVRAERAAADANPLIDYDVALGRFEPWQDERFAAIATKTSAEIIRENYGKLTPIALRGTDTAVALEAVTKAMRDLGFTKIRVNPDANSVEGVAETFWYGFKDDVVVRVNDGKIDFRSVSRVGLSDLGANAARIAKLRERVVAELP